MKRFAVLEIGDRVRMSDDCVTRQGGPRLTGTVTGYGRWNGLGQFLKVRHDSDGSEEKYAPWLWQRESDGCLGKPIDTGDFIPGTSKQAIETIYNGYRFRSRTEARWAIVFDVLGIAYEFEKEGYELPSGPYLPDFYLPQLKMFAEVKPGTFSQTETEKCFELATLTGCAVLMLDGQPAVKSYDAAEPQEDAGLQETSRWVLTNRKGCITNQGKLWSVWNVEPGDVFEDTEHAVAVAKSARFEHGETGPLVVRVEVERK